MKTLKVFKPEKQHYDLRVAINSGAVVSVGIGGHPVCTPREEALGWTILRLNAQVQYIKEDLEKSRVQIEELKKRNEMLDFYMWT